MKSNIPLRIGFVVPAYNKEREIFDALTNLAKVLIDCDYTILVIDDCSTDLTLDESLRFARTNERVLVSQNEVNMGKGSTVKRGFLKLAPSCDVIGYIDADLDISPVFVDLMIDAIASGQCEIAIASKHHRDSVVSYPFTRKCLSAVYFILTRILFDNQIHDLQTGLKLFKSELAHTLFLNLRSSGFAFDTEIVIHAQRLGVNVIEFPVELNYAFTSTLNAKTSLKTLKELFELKRTLG